MQEICSQAEVRSITAAQHGGKRLREEGLLDLDREKLRRRTLQVFFQLKGGCRKDRASEMLSKATDTCWRMGCSDSTYRWNTSSNREVLGHIASKVKLLFLEIFSKYVKTWSTFSTLRLALLWGVIWLGDLWGHFWTKLFCVSNHNLLDRSPVSQIPKHSVDTNILITFWSCATIPFVFLTALALPTPAHWAVHFQTRDLCSAESSPPCLKSRVQVEIVAVTSVVTKTPSRPLKAATTTCLRAIVSVVAPGGGQVCTVVEKILPCLWESHRTWFKVFSGDASSESFASLSFVYLQQRTAGTLAVCLGLQRLVQDLIHAGNWKIAL